jgi:hypothetical protein
MMGKYIHFTEEQKQRANNVDLVHFLRMKGEELLPSGKDKRLKSNHSITICGNEWFDHATEEGGLAIDFVQNIYGLSFPDAVTLLLGGEQGLIYPEAEREEKQVEPFHLPAKNNNMRRVFAYLIKHRLIDRDVLSFFAKEKLIYESMEQSSDKTKEYHNAIFVGYDENQIACHAHKKGIYTQGKSFKGNIASSDPCYSFHHIGTSNRLYVFEAPIDLLSFITIYKDTNWKKHSYVALCGLSEQAMIKMLEMNPDLSHVVLCLDYDPAGIEASEKFMDLLKEKAISCSQLLSDEKDWNEELKAKRDLKALHREEHPQHIMKKQICEEILVLLQEYEKTEMFDLDGEIALRIAKKQDASQAEAMKMATAVFLCLALNKYKQQGQDIDAAKMVEKMRENFRAYQNRSRWDPNFLEIDGEVATLKKHAQQTSEAEKNDLAECYEKIALAILKSTIKLELLQQKQIMERGVTFEMA